MTVLITGAAGFIGAALAHRLLSAGEQVVGIDNLNNYYSPSLKESRLSLLAQFPKWSFYKIDLADRELVEELFDKNPFRCVVSLAAQAGVRHSLNHPHTYVQSNVVGFLHVLEGCRKQQVEHLVFASTSSVYGAYEGALSVESAAADKPISLYAATKRANELMAYSYAHLYGFPITGLRFFSVYGPWGRPDMALFRFTERVLQDEPIEIYNHGDMQRNFTYIDDVVWGIETIMVKPPSIKEQLTPFQIFNLGNPHSVSLMELVLQLEKNLGKKAEKIFLPMQPGDTKANVPNMGQFETQVGFVPKVSLAEGVERFVQWYLQYYAPAKKSAL